MMAGLKHFRHRRHEVILFHVLDPAELDFPFANATLFKGLEELPTLAELRDLDEISKELNLPLDLGEQSASGQESQDEQQPAEAADDADHASGEGGSDGGLSMAAQANPELEEMGQAEALARAPVRVNE